MEIPVDNNPLPLDPIKNVQMLESCINKCQLKTMENLAINMPNLLLINEYTKSKEVTKKKTMPLEA